MEDTIFGVFSGMYSDWECHGYFPEADRAYQYCDVMNYEKPENSLHRNYYVMPIRRIQCEFAEKAEAPLLRYDMMFSMDRNGEPYVTKQIGESHYIDVGDEGYDDEAAVPELELDRADDGEKSFVRINRFGRVEVRVIMRGYDVQKAVEIAEEQVKQWKMDIVEFMMDRKNEINSDNLRVRQKWANATWVRGFDVE